MNFYQFKSLLPSFRGIFAMLFLGAPLVAHAIDLDVSGFGTLGYAISDQSFNYQRFVDDAGTLKRDSVLGAQVDLKFNSHWGATVQAKLGMAPDSDAKTDAALSWAFISWRPADDLLIRAGKLRVPFMLNTENQDVGATYAYARLPAEVYATAPTTDIYGVFLSKSWLFDDAEWSLDGYWGRISYFQRFYGREMTSSGSGGGAWFEPTKLQGGGLVLTVRQNEDAYRLGLHRVETQRKSGDILSDLSYAQLPFPPGSGFYDLSASPQVEKTVSPVLVVGASVGLPKQFRVASEYARVRVTNAVNGWDRWAAYIALSKQMGDWTPYAYYSILRSSTKVLRLYESVENTRVPPPWPAAINVSQRFAADMLMAHDQSTFAAGSAYRLTATQTLKAEWAVTRSGVVSSFIDAPAGGDSANKRVNVFSLSYNFTF